MLIREDCTSAFKWKRTIRFLIYADDVRGFHWAFVHLGEDCNINPQVLKQLEQFTYLSSVDVFHASLLRTMIRKVEKVTSNSKVNLARLPPCHSALKKHVQYMIQRDALYKASRRTDYGILEPAWSCGPNLPTSLASW